MSVYSEPLDHERIIGRLKDARSVMILACPFCASLSLAYYRDIPVYRLSRHLTWTNGSFQESLRLKKRLEGEGMTAGVFGLNGICSPFCTLDKWRKRRIKRKCSGYEGVVVLSCTGGLVGVSHALDRSARLVHGMRSLGCGTFDLKWKPPFEVVVDRDTARVSRFQTGEAE